MIYVISKVITNPSGEVFFNPSKGVEVFPTYISALRWLVSTKRFHIELGWKVWAMVPFLRPSSGRGELFALSIQSPFGYTYNLHVSRIPMNVCY